MQCALLNRSPQQSFVESVLLCVQTYDRLLITSWGHDPGVVPTSNVLTMLNDALTHSAVLIQVKHPYTPAHTAEGFRLIISGWVRSFFALCSS